MSYKRKMLNEIVTDYRKSLKRNIERIEKKADLLAFLEKRTGLDLVKDTYDLRYGECYNVKLSNIKAIKDVVGEFGEGFGKEMCEDYDTTGEIWVTCCVEQGLFDGFAFRYRHLLTDDDTCQVKETTEPSYVVQERTKTTLVCNRE